MSDLKKRKKKPEPVVAVVVAFDTLPGPSGGYHDAEWMTVTLRAPLGCAHHFPMGATVRCTLVPHE